MKTTIYNIPNAPDMAILADIHEKPRGDIIKSLKDHKPEIILIPGDFIYGSLPSKGTKLKGSKILPFLSLCASIAPTYASLGNHERILRPEDIEEVKKTGVVLLNNEWVQKNGIVIGGLSSGWINAYKKAIDRCKQRKDKATNPLYPHPHAKDIVKNPSPNLVWLNEFEKADGYKVLLCHHPEYWDVLQSRNINLVVSGHAHGGQCRYYSIRHRRWMGLYAPGQGLFPRYTEGLHSYSAFQLEKQLLISRGLSNTSLLPRFFNSREIVYIKGCSTKEVATPS